MGEGAEEGIFGWELNKWWGEGTNGWKNDPVDALGEGAIGKKKLKALLRHKWIDFDSVKAETK